MKLLDTLKENNQDFEWYPTTEEILKTIYNDLLKDSRFERNKSLLDIGAGNGKLFSCFDKYTEQRKKITNMPISIFCRLISCFKYYTGVK